MILVWIEQRAGVAKPVSWQLLGQATRLAAKIDAKVAALVQGDDVAHLAQEAIHRGADQVYLVEHPTLKDYRTQPYSQATISVIRQIEPEIALIGATYQGRDLAGAVVTHLPTGLTADCTMLDVDPETRLLQASRPAFSEKMMATILCKKYKPQMATARAGIFEALPKDESRSGEIIRVAFEANEADIATKLLDFIQDEAKVNLADAEVIVAGGRGVGGPQGFNLLNDLAQALGGEVGCSRKVVDAGWLPYEHQVGQTGQTVRPRLFIAVGISGAVQFTVGMQGAETIVAINRDPNAPIFNIAHYGIVGDYAQVLPDLIAAAQARGGAH